MSYRLVLLALGILLTLAGDAALAQHRTMKTIMREKLVRAEQLVDAVVTADFTAMARHAEALSHITETEIMSWQAAAQPEYAKQAMLFVLSIRGLQDAAAHRNIDAALAEYTTLISSCTRCHAHVQRSRVVSLTTNLTVGAPVTEPQAPTAGVPANATSLEGVPQVSVETTGEAATRRTLTPEDATRNRLVIRIEDGRFYWTGHDDRALAVTQAGEFIYLTSSQPGSYIRLRWINDRLTYAEHLEMGARSVTYSGELRVIIGK